MQRRRELMAMSLIQPPSGYRLIEYARSDTNISGGAHVDLPFGFDKTDELSVKASCETLSSDKFMVAPSIWNNNQNRFSVVGGPRVGNFGVGYGATATSSDSMFWPEDVIKRDLYEHIWTYKNYIFSLDGTLEIDVHEKTFGAATQNIRLFYGYNSNTAGKIYYYKHKKADGTTYNIVPIQHKTTGMVEMYDTVSKSIMPRTGTLYAPE